MTRALLVSALIPFRLENYFFLFAHMLDGGMNVKSCEKISRRVRGAIRVFWPNWRTLFGATFFEKEGRRARRRKSLCKAHLQCNIKMLWRLIEPEPKKKAENEQRIGKREFVELAWEWNYVEPVEIIFMGSRSLFAFRSPPSAAIFGHWLRLASFFFVALPSSSPRDALSLEPKYLSRDYF